LPSRPLPPLSLVVITTITITIVVVVVVVVVIVNVIVGWSGMAWMLPRALRRTLERLLYRHGLFCASHPLPVIIIVTGALSLASSLVTIIIICIIICIIIIIIINVNVIFPVSRPFAHSRRPCVCVCSHCPPLLSAAHSTTSAAL
jgi:hypothetical protein